MYGGRENGFAEDSDCPDGCIFFPLVYIFDAIVLKSLWLGSMFLKSAGEADRRMTLQRRKPCDFADLNNVPARRELIRGIPIISRAR